MVGQAQFRRVDLALFLQQCGAQALGIVTLVSFLVGLILAFVGAVQLRQFGAQIYVADLVGLAITREMGAMMTGVILAGRTGAAFAAQLGTMQVNEEIDALITMGIPPMEFLVLPRMLALMLMMPVLCVYADLVGILAGLLVSITLLHMPLIEYLNETRRAVDLVDCGIGVGKSVVFGALVALAGCLRGMQSGRSAAAVGAAATSAVVTGIVWIIASDGMFAVVTERLGISRARRTHGMTTARPRIAVQDLTMAYGSMVIQRNVTFSIEPGEIFIIMGGSGCGKSTLLRCLMGLLRPAQGEVFYDGERFWAAAAAQRARMMRRCGVLYQSGALWSSMTLAENVALPLETYRALRPRQRRAVVSLKLALVGLAGCEELYPFELSGGMRKRAALARAMALDPDILFFDEPSAGLDPLSSRRLDDLILELRASLGATIVVVTHELASIFTIGDNSVFLDVETKTMLAVGNPKTLRDASPEPKIRAFLNRGEADATTA
jgi:phospholipid/cholesterol/gamma-HCH transport system ATP-binding protein